MVRRCDLGMGGHGAWRRYLIVHALEKSTEPDVRGALLIWNTLHPSSAVTRKLRSVEFTSIEVHVKCTQIETASDPDGRGYIWLADYFTDESFGSVSLRSVDREAGDQYLAALKM